MSMKILSPAGNVLALKTAIFNGANEVYLGVNEFNARNNIDGFTMQTLKEKGTVVYLKLPYEVIANRLGDLKKRGVALKEGFTLKDLYEERTPLYEKYADVTVDVCNAQHSDSLDEICNSL